MWGTDDDTRTAYLDTQDVAKMTLAACRREEAANEVMTLAGPKAYSVAEVIQLCEKMGGAEANVSKAPVVLLNATRALTDGSSSGPRPRLIVSRSRRCSRAASSSTRPWRTPTRSSGWTRPRRTTLEGYLEEYFSKILKKLKEVGGQSRQKDFYL